MLYEAVLWPGDFLWVKHYHDYSVIILMKATEQQFHVLLFVFRNLQIYVLFWHLKNWKQILQQRTCIAEVDWNPFVTLKNIQAKKA